MKNEFSTYLESRFRLNTKRGIINEIKLYKFWCEKENLQIEAANYNDVMAYLNHCYSNGNKKQTVRIKLNSIKHYYDFIMQEEQTHYQINPAGEIRIRNIERSSIKNNVKYENIEKLYQSYSSGGLIQKRNKCILGLLIYQGLSIGEIDKLEVKDVKLVEGKIYIPAMARSNSRILNLESHQIMQLQNYILLLRPMLQVQAEDNSDYLFIAGNKSNRKKARGNTFTGIQRIFTNLQKLAPEIKEVQDIRSTVINHWLKKYNIRQVQYMIGHKYVSSTERYSTNKLESLQEQIELLHPFR
jgi:integrase/recombinase XerD